MVTSQEMDAEVAEREVQEVITAGGGGGGGGGGVDGEHIQTGVICYTTSLCLGRHVL